MFDSPGKVAATLFTKWTNAPGGVASTTSDMKLYEDEEDDAWPSTDAVSRAGKGFMEIPRRSVGEVIGALWGGGIFSRARRFGRPRWYDGMEVWVGMRASHVVPVLTGINSEKEPVRGTKSWVVAYMESVVDGPRLRVRVRNSKTNVRDMKGGWTQALHAAV